MFLNLGIFAIPILLKIKKILFVFCFYCIFNFIFNFIISAGNRMPIIMLIVFVTLLAIIIKKKNIKRIFSF